MFLHRLLHITLRLRGPFFSFFLSGEYVFCITLAFFFVGRVCVCFLGVRFFTLHLFAKELELNQASGLAWLAQLDPTTTHCSPVCM